MKNEISVIVPVYNGEKVLSECLDSILRQTYSPLSVILVDDGSTDQSGKICDQYAQKDSRIQVIHQENKGLVMARVSGISALPEEGYAAFCDADDFLPDDAMEKLWAKVQQTQADIVQGGVRRFFGRHLFGKHIFFGTSSSAETIYTHEELCRQEILENFLGGGLFQGVHVGGAMWSKLYKNSLLKASLNFEKPTRFYQEDVVFNMQMCQIAEKVVIMPDVVYYYRVGGGSTGYKPSYVEDALKIYAFKQNYIREHGYDDSYYDSIAVEMRNEMIGFFTSIYHQNRKSPQEAREIMKELCDHPQVVHAFQPTIKWSKIDQRWIDTVRKKDIESLYQLAAERDRSKKAEKAAKFILRRL